MNPRYLVCIPTFDNPETISTVVSDCLAACPYPVLVVDDGSKIPVESLLQASSRVSVLRLPENQGKGAALQAAFREAVRQGYTHLISVDGDGQHLPQEIAKLTRAADQHPWDLVIGERKLASENVPGVSKFGRKFSNFWVRFETEARVRDSQCGFRIYPLFHVQGLRFFTRRFDFEIEVLIRLLWKGVGVREVEIDVYYPKPDERVSHFHKLWDNVRISMLNTVLVTLSLLRTPKSPAQVAVAVGLGVWIGCTPFFGLHSLIAAGVALLFRLNFVYLWIGTQVSIPPLAPVLAVASVRIGTAIKGYPPSGLRGYSERWLLGSIVLGAALGLVGACAAFAVSRGFNQPRKSWNGRTRGGRFGNGFLKFLLKHGRLEIAYFCLNFIVPYFYLFAPKARRAANQYWRHVRPEVGFFRRQGLVLRQLFQFARILLDRVYQSLASEPRFTIRRNGIENILEPVRAKEGLILLGAHVGGWDLAASALRPDGMPGDFHMVRFEADGMTLNQVKGSEDAQNLAVVPSNGGNLPILKIRELLAAGKPVGFMGDRPLARQFELVNFFGMLAPFDTTPFRIAATCEARLLFTFAFKGAGRGYDFYATPSRRYTYEAGTPRATQVLRWTREFAAVLEGHLRRYPEQWANFFPFWSTPPAGLPEESAETRASDKSPTHSEEVLRRPATPAPDSEPVATPSV